jgi:ribose transport system substrate-binding protein
MKKGIKRLLGLIAILTVGIFLAACTMEESETGEDTGTETAETTEETATTETTETDDTESDETTEDLSIGFSISTLNNPFFVSMADGAEAKAEELGVEINVIDAGNDPAKQSTDIEDLITTGIDVLIVNPEDSASVGTAVQSAIDQGIPVIALDREVEGAEVDTFIGTDNEVAAQEAAEELLNYLEAEDEVVILEGVPGASSAIDRQQGFMNALEGNANVVATQTANFDRTEGLTVTENLLQAHPNLRAIVAANDEMALGAIEAINGAGMTAGEDILVTGFDANDDALSAVEAGSMLLTVEQKPDEMGQVAVETALSLHNGESVESEIPTDVSIVDAETLNN